MFHNQEVTMGKKKGILHGEAMVFEGTIPEGAKRVDTTGKQYVIIAPSEQTGNHHVIDVVDGVEFYEKDGKLFLKTEVETQVRCVIAERHDAITIQPGCYEIDSQQEYDPFEARLRAVRD